MRLRADGERSQIIRIYTIDLTHVAQHVYSTTMFERVIAHSEINFGK